MIVTRCREGEHMGGVEIVVDRALRLGFQRVWGGVPHCELGDSNELQVRIRWNQNPDYDLPSHPFRPDGDMPIGSRYRRGALWLSLSSE
jgi:hypothetical protein